MIDVFYYSKLLCSSLSKRGCQEQLDPYAHKKTLSMYVCQYGRKLATVESREVELWPCGYTARCSAQECR
jgi:hypothetical protein